jgi:hypothetical protein
VGTGVVHPINLAASTAATTGQVLAINDEGNFEWVTIGDSSETVSVGDITSVIAGTGIIVANGTSGDATVSLNTTYTDNRYVNVTGDDMIGALTITGTDSSMLSVSNAGSNTRGISSIASEGYGVYGINGATTGSTPSNYRAGVYGETNGTGWNYNGVYGQADNSVGVYGYSGSEDYPGIRGYNDGGGVGIYGHTADSDSDNFGIYGVHGEADESDGRGVYGESDSGVGVYGESTSGYSGYFNGELRVEGDINQELDHGGAVKAMAYVDVSEECIAEPTEVGRQYNSQGGIIECQIGATGIFDVDFNFDISNRYIQVTSINGTYDIAEASHVSVIPNTVDVDTVRVFIQDGATLDMANRDFYIAVF